MADINKLKNKARREEQRENWTGAIELYKKALLESERERDGAADLSLFNRIGDIHLRLGDKRQAVQFYEQAIRRYADQDLHTSAIALCNKVLRILPDRLDTYRQLGQLQAASGLAADARANYLHYASEMMKARRTDRALEALEECAEATGDQGAALRLAGLFIELGREEEAVSRLEGLRDRLRERGAKVDRLEARLADLGLAAGAESPATDAESSGTAEAVADVEAELIQVDHVPDAAHGAPAASAAVGDVPVEAGPRDQAAGGMPDGATVGEIPAPRFPPEQAEAPAPLVSAPRPGPRSPGRQPVLDGVENLQQLPAGPAAGAARPPGERVEASLWQPKSLLRPRARELEETAEGPAIASLEPGATEAAPEAVERTSGRALREALEAVSQRLSRTANGGYRTSGLSKDGVRRDESPHEPSRISVQHLPDGGQPLPELPAGEPDRSEPPLDGPEHLRGPDPATWSSFDVERPEAVPYLEASPRGEAVVGLAATPALEEIETGIEYPGTALLEQGLAARADDSLEAAVAAFEAALACPDVFVQAYAELRECREALAARADAQVEVETPGAGADVELSRPAAEVGTPKVEAEVEAPNADKEVEALRGRVDAGAEVEALRGRVDADAVAAPERSEPGDSTLEFQQWVQTAPPGLLERSLRELQARGETKKAALVSDRLRALAATTDRAGVADDDNSGREPSGPPIAQGDAMQYPTEGIEPTRDRPAMGGTDLLEVPTRESARGDAPLPYDRLAGDAGAVDFDELLSELKTSLAENQVGPDTRSRTELGAELKSMGLLDEAIRELQAAVREPSAPPEAYELLGEAFIEKGQPRIAARLLASAVMERGFGDRESLGVLYQLGLAYEQLADRDEALDCYERIFSVDIDYRDIKERIVACSG